MGTVAGAIGSFATSAAAARLVTSRDFAGVLLVITTLGLGPVVVRAGLGNNAIRSVAQSVAIRGNPETGALLNSIVRTTIVLGALLSIPVAALILATARPDLVADVPLLGIALFFETLRMTSSDVFTGLQMTMWSVLFSFQFRSVVLGATFMGMAIGGIHLSLTTLLVVLVGINGLLSVSAMICLKGRLVPFVPGVPMALIRTLIRGSFPFFVAEASLFVIARGDIWVAARILGPIDGSVYGAASTMANQLAIAVSVAGLAIAPLASSLAERGQMAMLEKLARLMAAAAFVVTAAGVGVVLVGGRQLLGIAYGHGFTAGYVFLLILSVGSLVAVVTGPTEMILLMTGRQRRAMRVAVLWAAAAIVVLPLGALLGAGVGLAIASSAMTAGCNVHLLMDCRRSVGITTLPLLRLRSISRTWQELHHDPLQDAK